MGIGEIHMAADGEALALVRWCNGGERSQVVGGGRDAIEWHGGDCDTRARPKMNLASDKWCGNRWGGVGTCCWVARHMLESERRFWKLLEVLGGC
jgi:hypothetical protein